jgi:vacuolar-type H+-ATPase subunit I/STV1
MLNSLKEYLKIEGERESISESIISKGYAIAQHRAHSSNKNKLNSLLSRIQSNAKKGQTEDNSEERFELLFTLFIDLANAMKVSSEMQANAINVSTAGVLFAENVQRELKKITSQVRP